MRFLYAIVYCVFSTVVGAVIGAILGTGLAGLLMKPEEAVVLVTGVSLGGPAGALIGFGLGLVHVSRRPRQS
jgi:hypothetical protein